MRPKDNDKDRTTLTQAMRDELIELQERTGWGARTLYNYAQKHKLNPLFTNTTYGLIEGWVHGDIKTVNRDQFNTILHTYKNIPRTLWKNNTYQAGRIPINGHLKEKIDYIIDNTSNLSLLMKHGQHLRASKKQYSVNLISCGFPTFE